MATVSKYPTAAGSRWRVRYRKPDGHWTDKRGFTLKRDAELWLAATEVAKQRGEYVAPADGKITVDVLGREWLAARAHLKETTRVNAEHHFKRIVATWGERTVGSIQTPQVRAWVARMVEDGAGPATITAVLGDFSQMMDYAVEARRIARNPAKGVQAPKLAHRRRGYLSHGQVAALADVVAERSPGLDFDVLVRFLAYTGLRFGEAAGLRVDSVDHVRGRVDVLEAVAEAGGKLIRSQTKTYQRRSVPFPAFLAPALSELVAGRAGEDPLFPAAQGGALRLNAWRARHFTPAVAAARTADTSFPHVTPHDLRHTAVSLAISAGANVKAVQRMVGHAKAAMTLDTYADLFPDDLDDVAARLDRAAAPRGMVSEVAGLRDQLGRLEAAVGELAAGYPAGELEAAGVDLDTVGGLLEQVAGALGEQRGQAAA